METLKHFACPQCNLIFTTRESRPHQSRLPLILSCGHSLCERCIRKSAKDHRAVICPCCHKIFSLKDVDEDILKLPPDIHALGVLALSNRKPFDLKVKLVPAGHKFQEFKAVPENDSTVICDECSKSAAHWSCDKCAANFCNICFDLIHRGSKLMKKHEGKPLYVEGYRSIIQSGCAEHDSRSVEFYCEDDGQVVCSYCVVMGDHKGHNIISLVDKNQSCTDNLQCSIMEGQKFCYRLKLTEKKLSELIPEEKIDTSLLVKEVHSRFHIIHGLLQLRELEIIKELERLSNENVICLEKMRQEASDQLKQLTALIRDAEKILNNSFIPINVVDVLKNLYSAKEIPCHLVPTENAKDIDDIKIEFDQNFVDGISQFGKVEADIRQKYKLCTDAELPSDYKVEEIDEDLILNTDTESLNSSVADDVSARGSTPLHTPDSQAPKISPLFKSKKASVLTQEIVFVTHIKDPDHFYVQRFSEVKKLQNLSENINKWCRSCESLQQVPKVLNVGDIFLVQYGLDKKWYRARVLRIHPSPKDPGRALHTGEESEIMQNLNNEVNRNLSGHSDNSLVGEEILQTSGNDITQSDNVSSTDNEEIVEEMEGLESYNYTCESQNTSEADNLPQQEVDEQRNLCADPVTTSDKLCDDTHCVGDLQSSEDTRQDVIVFGESEVEVLYVDFGNTEIVPQSRLKLIQPNFLSLSWQALRCALWGIVPSDKVAWSQKAIKLFAQFVANKQVRMKVIEQRNDVLYVDLCETETDNIKNEVPVSVRDALVFLEVACFLSPYSNDKTVHPKRKYFPPDQFRPGQKLNVVLSQVENPVKFFVQQLGGGARHLSNLIFQMQEKFSDSKRNLPAVFAPYIGMAVVGKFSVDKNWYRAEVISLPGDSKVEVRYVDFGNTEVLPYWDLHKITDDYMKLPAQAISCSLSDVAPPQGKEWWDECKQFMMEVAGKEQLTMKVNRTLPGRDTVLVSLFKSEKDSDVCINGLLVQHDLAISTGPQSAKVIIPHLPSSDPPVAPISKPTPLTNVTSEEESSSLASGEEQSNSDVSLSEEKKVEKEHKKKVPFIPVHVSYASSPDSVYVQLATKEGERLDG
ncbi:RING finger protein 17-like isoform X2 [Tachypleus tridentatus]